MYCSFLCIVWCWLGALGVVFGSRNRRAYSVLRCLNLTRFSFISRGHYKHRTQELPERFSVDTGRKGDITEVSFTKWCSNLFYGSQVHLKYSIQYFFFFFNLIFYFVSNLCLIFKVVLRMNLYVSEKNVLSICHIAMF